MVHGNMDTYRRKYLWILQVNRKRRAGQRVGEERGIEGRRKGNGGLRRGEMKGREGRKNSEKGKLEGRAGL